MRLDHAAARAGRNHDVFEVLEFVQEFFGQRACRLPVAGVITGLATASLQIRDHHFAPIGFQQFERGKTDFRPHHVDQTGHK